MSFYDEMAQMAEELLAPTSRGGLGQGIVTLRRELIESNEEEPWEPGTLFVQEEQVRAVVQAVDQDGGSASYSNNSTVLIGDLIITCAVPKTVNWNMGGDDRAALFVIIDGGRKLPVVQSTTIPAAGTPVVVRLFARGVS